MHQLALARVAACRPCMVPTSIGNWLASAAIAICTCGPVPSQSASSGAVAMIGIAVDHHAEIVDRCRRATRSDTAIEPAQIGDRRRDAIADEAPSRRWARYWRSPAWARSRPPSRLPRAPERTPAADGRAWRLGARSGRRRSAAAATPQTALAARPLRGGHQ